MIFATVIAAVEHLKADPAVFEAWPTIGSAADFAALSNVPVDPWALYVIPLSERPGDSKWCGAIIQYGDQSLGVVMSIQAANDATGSEVMAVASERIELVRSRLVGWCPPGCEAITFSRGALLEFRPGLMVWRDDYTTTALPMTQYLQG